MDGIHDLGGKQGFGPIDVDDEYGFHADWEGREWGIAQCARTPGITIDWWRHCRELIQPVDYLERPYFDSWAQTDFATYIEAGWISLEEIAAGGSASDGRDYGGPVEPLTLEQVLEADRAHAFRFDAETDIAPAFQTGDSVTASKHGHGGHTRLPQYARGHRGTIHAHRGAHVFPDLSAEGTEVHQHLYTVMFHASELWAEAGNSPDKVFLDLWESYLEAG